MPADQPEMVRFAASTLVAVALVGFTMLGRWIMVRRAIAAALRARSRDPFSWVRTGSGGTTRSASPGSAAASHEIQIRGGLVILGAGLVSRRSAASSASGSMQGRRRSRRAAALAAGAKGNGVMIKPA
jgi:hypothetical protein